MRRLTYGWTFTQRCCVRLRRITPISSIGTQLRGALSADRINWGAVLYDVEADVIHQAAVRENIEIADRTGGGDSFASGIVAALLKGKDPAEAVQWGAAHGILVQETIGDTSMVKQGDVEKEVARAIKGAAFRRCA